LGTGTAPGLGDCPIVGNVDPEFVEASDELFEGETASYTLVMSEPAKHDADQPEVAALRKKIRGEKLTPEEEALLAGRCRKAPEGIVTLSLEQVTALLEERRRQGE
jgi:hypothetical protein